jgi:hypothetical protein
MTRTMFCLFSPRSVVGSHKESLSLQICSLISYRRPLCTPNHNHHLASIRQANNYHHFWDKLELPFSDPEMHPLTPFSALPWLTAAPETPRRVQESENPMGLPRGPLNHLWLSHDSDCESPHSASPSGPAEWQSGHRPKPYIQHKLVGFLPVNAYFTKKI